MKGNFTDAPTFAGIYALTYAPTGEQYIGASTNIQRRLKAHLNAIASGSQPHWVNRVLDRITLEPDLDIRNPALHVASCTEWEVVQPLPGASYEEIQQAEDFWIQTLKPALNDQRCTRGRYAAKQRRKRTAQPMIDSGRRLEQLKTECKSNWMDYYEHILQPKLGLAPRTEQLHRSLYRHYQFAVNNNRAEDAQALVDNYSNTHQLHSDLKRLKRDIIRSKWRRCPAS